MSRSSPRLPWPLVVEVRRLGASDRSTAEICREAGRFAAGHGFHRPSYETVRRLVRNARDDADLPGVWEPILEGWLRARSLQSASDETFRRAERRARARRAVEDERSWRPEG
jgi:hypothetical protein